MVTAQRPAMAAERDTTTGILQRPIVLKSTLMITGK